MVIQQITILSLLIIQALSAPTGCIESCSTYYKQYQTSGNFQDHALQSALPGLDYSRPGTWTEHNNYNVDNGHGKVYEERGQYVTGPKTVRYYKKNYTSSYSTGLSNSGGLLDVERQNSNYRHGVLVPNVYDQTGSESTAQQHSYNSMQSQQHMQSSIRRTGAQSERLEDFGEYTGNSEALQQGLLDSNAQVSQVPYYTQTQPGNWSKVDSYKTDGGRGRVFEEEGQYQTGGKKVRFYKKNYTSSYSTYGGIPVPTIGVPDLHKEIDKLHREIGKEFSQTSSVQNIGSSDVALTNLNTYDSSNLHNINSNKYRNQNDYQSSSSITHNEDQQSSTSEHLTNPSPNSYGTNSYNMYEKHEGHVIRVQPVSQVINPTSGYTSVLNTGNTGHTRNMFNTGISQQEMHNIHQAEHLDTQQSTLDQSEMFSDNLRQSGYNQNGAIQSGTLGQSAHYKEHWSSSHTKEASVPQYTSGISHMQYNNQYGNQYESGHGMHQSQQQDSYMNQLRENRFNSAQRTHLGKLVTGTLDLSHTGDTVDCDSQHEHSSSRYNRKYKRGIRDGEDQHSEDLTQQTSEQDDFMQQTSGKLQFGQESQQTYQPWRPGSANQQSEDLTQQTSENDDFTQQTSGKLEFGQESQQTYQPWRQGSANQQSEDLTQQTSENDDFTQQTSGKLEFGQQSYQPWRPGSANQQSEDLTQQTSENDDYTQQTSGKLEFGQQSYQPWRPGSANQRSEDLTQQTSENDDLTQQTSGKLELGQQSYQPWKPGSANQQSEDLTQQTSENDDLTQQTSGKLEFGQQSYQPWKPGSANQQSEDLTQQTSENDDLTQQTSGKLELGQQSYQPWKPGSANQQSEDLTQQTSENDDLTQQTSGKLEFGQQSYQPWRPDSANQQSEDLTQQTSQYDDLTQQTSGNLEFGQQTFHPWGPSSANQQSEDMTQQTSGKIEFGQESQQSYQSWKPSSTNQRVEDLTQQSSKYDDLTQETSGNLEFGQQSYQPWRPGNANRYSEDLTQQTGMSDDFTQQTFGKLEFGQQSQNDKTVQGSSSHVLKPAEKPKPRSRYSRVGSADQSGKETYIPNIYELPPYVGVEGDDDKIRNQEMRGDQTAQNSNENISKDLDQQTVVLTHNVEGENVDQANWLHKSNDATVGLQWHYTYHPSDQRQLVQQTDQKDKEQQQTSQIKFSNLEQTSDQQETQGKYLFDDLYQQSSNQENQESQSYLQSQDDAFGQTAKFDQVTGDNNKEKGYFTVNQQASEIENEQKHIRSSQTVHQLEPRILEAYGGGPYDVSHGDDIYHGITVNPSVTLPPINSADPWDIREKPRETEATPPPMPVEPLITDDPTEETTPAPSFWSKLSHKITNTFDKAKEKARNIFG